MLPASKAHPQSAPGVPYLSVWHLGEIEAQRWWHRDLPQVKDSALIYEDNPVKYYQPVNFAG
jgi:hypothetical protein